jgi:hypothetical protein
MEKESVITVFDEVKKELLLEPILYYNNKTINNFFSKKLPSINEVSNENTVVEIIVPDDKITIEWVSFLCSIDLKCFYDGVSVNIYKKEHTQLSFKITLVLVNYLMLKRKSILSTITWIKYNFPTLTNWEKLILAHYSNNQSYLENTIIPKCYLKDYSKNFKKYKKIDSLFNNEIPEDVKNKISSALDTKNIKNIKKLLCQIKK